MVCLLEPMLHTAPPPPTMARRCTSWLGRITASTLAVVAAMDGRLTTVAVLEVVRHLSMQISLQAALIAQTSPGRLLGATDLTLT